MVEIVYVILACYHYQLDKLYDDISMQLNY